ncbi:SWIM zinc finger family protein [Gorillibacterium sp. CAU 1737]|uniref:SWIM zinc finger family protein n=1 Tax=Gorillibacterium sp. CAU 1737 TaxID=3140362 RepID=UPI003261699E
MAPLRIPYSRMEALIKAMEPRLESVILARGWNYYHRGRVGELSLQQGTQLEVDVAGSGEERYHVTFDLEKPEHSSCTCPYKGWCKHRVAALFKAYTAHGRPELLFVSLQKAAGAKVRARAAQDRQPKREAPAVPLPTELPEEWHQHFDRRFSGYTLTYQQSVEGFFEMALRLLLPLASGWKPEIAGLFRVHVYLFILHRLDRFQLDNETSFMTYYHEGSARNTSIRGREALRDAARSVDAAQVKLLHPASWEKTMTFVREALFRREHAVSDRLDTYRILWWELFGRVEDSFEERKRLALLREERTVPVRLLDLSLLAEAQFDVLDGQDAAAMRLLENLQEKKAGDFEAILGALSEKKEWRRLLDWLRWLLPALPRARQDEFHRLCSHWTEAARELDAHDEWVAAMRSLLPRSYPYYTEYLLKYRRFREWVDLQLAVRVSAESLYTADFKSVQEASPELMLPIYHQAIERTIAEKNRNAYKEAIRQLKRLRSCYQQAELSHRWTVYIGRLADKHNRLRAFQEELTKGNLLP